MHRVEARHHRRAVEVEDDDNEIDDVVAVRGRSIDREIGRLERCRIDCIAHVDNKISRLTMEFAATGRGAADN